jgi:tetratricopeptide (TPR) repeat protein
MDSFAEVDSQYSPVAPRRRLGGWIVGAVLLTGVGVIAYRVAAPYLATASKTGVHKALDPRTEQFLTEGESAFREGNLDLAKEKFDKASALDEGDPRVLLDVARQAAARADIPWLKTRVLPETSEDELRAAKQQLAELGATAKRAADAAGAAAPDDVAAIRARVDALRIVGERDGARGYVTKIIGNASQPETSYVLAALDLAEIDPLWTTVIDRLRVAAAGEGNAGRARAALVYALVRSGDVVGAKAELERLSLLPTPYPLLAPLRGFVTKGPPGKLAVAAGSASGHAAAAPSAAPSSVDFESLPRRPTGGGGAPSEEPTGGSSDPRELLRQASAAENKGQFPRARQLYEDAMHADPANSEALAGLGSVSLKTGDYASARSYFGHALGLNPNYVPALVGQADAMWAEGDHTGATARYKEIVDRFPESSGYPSYVKTRAEGSASGSAPPASHANEPATAAPAVTTKEPLPPGSTIPLPANIPSDLPGTPP